MFANAYGPAQLSRTIRNSRLTRWKVISPRQFFHTQNAIVNDSPELALLLERYSKEQPRPLTLQQLLSFGSPLTKDSLLESASYALTEIPRRLVRRVHALESLPFIVTMNPFLSRTLRAYRETFEALATYPAVRNMEDNWKFTQKLEGIVTDHANDIPTMARGYVCMVVLQSFPSF